MKSSSNSEVRSVDRVVRFFYDREVSDVGVHCIVCDQTRDVCMSLFINFNVLFPTKKHRGA